MSHVRYLPHQDWHGGNLFGGNSPSFGQVDTVEDGQLVSGFLMDQTRNFTKAFVMMGGGTDWGTSYMPQVGDVGLVLYNIHNAAFFFPFSANYGVEALNVDSAAALGFKHLVAGELHHHSKAHAEMLMDAMGNTSIYDSVGDYVQLDAARATLRMRAWHQMVQEFGFNDDGSAGVTVTAGLISDAAGFYDDSDPTAFHPNASTYHISSTGSIIFDVVVNGNKVSISINDAGVQVDPGTNDGSVPVIIGSGEISQPVLYSKLPVQSPGGSEIPIVEFNEIGASKFLRVGVDIADLQQMPLQD